MPSDDVRIQEGNKRTSSSIHPCCSYAPLILSTIYYVEFVSAQSEVHIAKLGGRRKTGDKGDTMRRRDLPLVFPSRSLLSRHARVHISNLRRSCVFVDAENVVSTVTTVLDVAIRRSLPMQNRRNEALVLDAHSSRDLRDDNRKNIPTKALHVRTGILA